MFLSFFSPPDLFFFHSNFTFIFRDFWDNQKHINMNNVGKYCRLILGGFKECLASFHAFKMRKYEAKKKEQATNSVSKSQQTTTTLSTRTKLAVHDAIHQWASQIFRHLNTKPKEIMATTFTIAPMRKIQRRKLDRSSMILGPRIL